MFFCYRKILTRVDKELNKSLTKLYWCEIRLTLSEYQKCARTGLQKDRVQQLVRSFITLKIGI